MVLVRFYCILNAFKLFTYHRNELKLGLSILKGTTVPGPENRSICSNRGPPLSCIQARLQFLPGARLWCPPPGARCCQWRCSESGKQDAHHLEVCHLDVVGLPGFTLPVKLPIYVPRLWDKTEHFLCFQWVWMLLGNTESIAWRKKE